LLERLEEGHVVVVSGPAGYGKSALAKHAMERLHAILNAPIRERFDKDGKPLPRIDEGL
jgi:hypothetical protein